MAANARCLVLLLLATAVQVFAQVGDVVIWIPPDSLTSSKQAQIPHNRQYVSIKLQSVYAYYKSGFFENIRKLLIQSNVKLDSSEGSMINASHDKVGQEGEFIGLNDHIALLSPTTPSQVTISVSFRGLGEDRFKAIFDLLSGSDLKVPLDMSAATLAKVSGITGIVRKFVSSPYVSTNPRQILDVSQSFVLYEDVSRDYPDALRSGYFVIVSARERKSDDLAMLSGLGVGDIRLSPQGQFLQFRDRNGMWKDFTHNSYVVLSVTQTPVRGENQSSPWFSKYRSAEEAARGVKDSKSAEQVNSDAQQLWRQANALLDADANYVEGERRQISELHWKSIEDNLKITALKSGTPLTEKARSRPRELPPNYAELAANYDRLLKENTGSLEIGALNPNASLTLVKPDAHLTFSAQADETGHAYIRNLLPGQYVIEGIIQGLNGEIKGVVVDPGKTTPFDWSGSFQHYVANVPNKMEACSAGAMCDQI